MTDEIARIRHELRFGALRNAFYHSARLRHFEWQHRWLMFGIVVTGTAGVSTVLTTWMGGAFLSGVTALLAALDLVLDLRGKAQIHDGLKRRYYLLLAVLDENETASAAELQKTRGEIMRITAEEPVGYRAVDAAAHNEAIDTMGLDAGEKQVLSRLQRLFRHYYTAQGVEFPYARDVAAAKAAAKAIRMKKTWKWWINTN